MAGGLCLNPLTQNEVELGVLFCIYQEHMVLLQGFIKKTQKTPKQDLDLALTRKKNLEAGK
ncbi:MAG: type II toxin-antitoxin system RelE/ParE family toxin [Cyanobacteria bacterium J06627_3]